MKMRKKQKNLKKISTFTCTALLHITRQQPSGSLKGLLSGQEKVHVKVYIKGILPDVE